MELVVESVVEAIVALGDVIVDVVDVASSSVGVAMGNIVRVLTVASIG